MLLAAPAAASAAVTCDYSSAGKLLTVALGAADDTAQLEVVAGEIKVTPVACTGPGGPPTVANTGAISVTGNADGQIVLIRGADDFVPGPDPQDGSDSGGGSKEIEIFVNMSGARSLLRVSPGNDGGEIVFGTDGINPNVGGEASPRDADIFPNNVERLEGQGGTGNDSLHAQGGFGTGGALSAGIVLNGFAGSDALTGGEGPDDSNGGFGSDSLLGMGGDDQIAPSDDNDFADGGSGSDTVVLTHVGAAQLDLAIAGPQDTGEGSDSVAAFENATSGDGGPATLRGDDGPNVLTSGSHDDTLEGRGGVDVLDAREGADTLDVRDGGPDAADCGPDADTVTADNLGIDMLTGCESVIFPPPPAPGGGGGQVLAAAFGARTLVTLALTAKRIPARGPLAIRVLNANEFDVSGRLFGETTQRLSSAQRKRRIKLKAKSFRVLANARKTVKLRLPTALRRQLARKRRLSLRLTAKVRDPAGNTRTVRKTLKPRLRRQRRL